MIITLQMVGSVYIVTITTVLVMARVARFFLVCTIYHKFYQIATK
jgi:hypothetical protein